MLVNKAWLKDILDATVGQIVNVLSETLNCKVSLNVIEQNTTKPGTKFVRKVTVSADDLPIIRALVEFDTKDLPYSVVKELLTKKRGIGTILNTQHIKCDRNVILLDPDFRENEIKRVYEIRHDDKVWFLISEEINLNLLSCIKNQKT